MLDDADLNALLAVPQSIEHGFVAVEHALAAMASPVAHRAGHHYLPMVEGERYSLLIDAQPRLGTSLRSFPADGTSATMDAVAWMLVSPQDGSLLAVFTARQLSALRTAFPSIAGARRLTRGPVRRIAILGTGRQAHAHARLLGSAFPELVDVRVHGCDLTRGQAVTEALRLHGGLPARYLPDRQDTLSGAQLIFLLGAPGKTQVALGEVEPDAVLVSLSGSVSADLRALATTYVPTTVQPDDLSGARQAERVLEAGCFSLADVLAGSGKLVRDPGIIIWELGGLYGWDAVIARWAYDAAVTAGIGTTLRA